MNRRTLLVALTGGAATLAGCSSLGSPGNNPPTASTDQGPAVGTDDSKGTPTDASMASIRIQTDRTEQVKSQVEITKPSGDIRFDDSIAVTAENPFIRHDTLPIPADGAQEYTVTVGVEDADGEITESTATIQLEPSDNQQVVTIEIEGPDSVSVTVESVS